MTLIALLLLALAIVAVLYRIEGTRRLVAQAQVRELDIARLRLQLEAVKALPDGAIGTRTF